MSGAAIAGAGAGIGAIGTLMAGQSTEQAMYERAAIARRNAQNANISAAINANRSMLFAQHKIGTIQASYGASGVESTSGSVVDVLGASAANAELDRQDIIYGGNIRATAFQNQASMDEKAGDNALTASYFQAGGGMLLGASRFGSSGGGDSEEEG